MEKRVKLKKLDEPYTDNGLRVAYVQVVEEVANCVDSGNCFVVRRDNIPVPGEIEEIHGRLENQLNQMKAHFKTEIDRLEAQVGQAKRYMKESRNG